MSELPVLRSALLDEVPGVRHAFFTRRGGVSTGLYASLNVGLGSGDDPVAVGENRRRAAAWFAAETSALVTCYQIHSSVALVAGPWGEQRPQGDALVTGTPGLVCSVLSADCAPVLLADPQARVVAAAHAGWRGALGGVVTSSVASMAALGADPDRIVAAVGPCIGPNSYEVGADFLDEFLTHAPEAERFFRAAEGPDKRLFDLPGFVLDRLARAGVRRAEWLGHDTCAEADQFFSNRRAHHRGEPDYGRLLSAIMLE